MFFLNPGQELKIKFSRVKKNNFNPGQELKIKFSRVKQFNF